MTSYAYDLHGATVQSDLPLPAIPTAEGDRPDLTFRGGGWVAVPPEVPPGEVLVECRTEGRLWHAAVAEPTGFRFRVPRICDFLIDRDRREVRWCRDPESSDELVSILLAGAVSAFMLELGGACVLHASAVTIGGAALGIVGASGMGKSTVAALLIEAGASLVTDDLLRITFPDGAPWVHPGTHELRLRHKARSVADRANGGVRATADGRLGLSTNPSYGPVPLTGLVLPRPSRQHEEVEVTPVGPADAVLLLSRFPRLHGWRAPTVLVKQLEYHARLASSIPLYRAIIPWGPPFAPTLGIELLRQVLGHEPSERLDRTSA